MARLLDEEISAMNLLPWDPWKELERLKTQTDRLWDEFLEKLTQCEPEPERIAFLPDVDLVESPLEYRLYLSVPGLIEEDIDIDVEQHALTIRGERQPPYDLERAGRRIREWRYGFFQRRVRLPIAIRPSAVRASYDMGVLTIVVPKERDA